MAAVAAVLSGYPQYIVDYISDPRTGISGTNKWLPSVAEVRDACEAKMNEVGQNEARKARIEQQLRQREEWEREVPERFRAKGKAWLERKDPVAQELTGQKPVKVYSDEEKRALLDDAVKVGREISGMMLSPEALMAISDRDELQELEGREEK